MSAQSIAKAAQGYVAKAVPRTCANCQRFASDMVMPAWMALENEVRDSKSKWGNEFKVDGNFRCTLGGFAVKKMGTCREFRLKVAP